MTGLPEGFANEPHQFDFYHTLRQIECQNRGFPRLGSSRRPKEDPIRLGQDPSLLFAASTFSSTAPRAKGAAVPRLAVHFFGLFGPNGPLPLHLTEYARDRLREKPADETLVAFADLFHHRLLSLFYRARAAAEPTHSFDRREDDHFARQLGSLCGYGLEGLRDRDNLADEGKLHFAGRLASETRTPEGLAGLLREFLAVPNRIEEFVGQWLRLPRDCRCQLGGLDDNARLGGSTLLGERVWDRQSRFDIHLGPLSFPEFAEFLPEGRGLPLIGAIVRNYVGDQFDWSVHLVLRGEDVPATRLGQAGRLGQTTWLYRAPPSHSVSDVVVRPELASPTPV
jgi:type VI secretion system protein ImpH